MILVTLLSDCRHRDWTTDIFQWLIRENSSIHPKRTIVVYRIKRTVYNTSPTWTYSPRLNAKSMKIFCHDCHIDTYCEWARWDFVETRQHVANFSEKWMTYTNTYLYEGHRQRQRCHSLWNSSIGGRWTDVGIHWFHCAHLGLRIAYENGISCKEIFGSATVHLYHHTLKFYRGLTFWYFFHEPVTWNDAFFVNIRSSRLLRPKFWFS